MVTGPKDVSAAPAVGQSAGDGAVEPGMAIADAITELIGIFTHDLSNPLQSLTVLLELTLDDLPSDSDEHARLGQSLEATERMRQMIRDFAGLARSGRSPSAISSCSAALERVLGLLRRRFDRHKIRYKINLGDVAEVPVPASTFEMGLLSLLLSAVAASADSEFATFEFSIVGAFPAKLGPGTARIEFGMAGHRHIDQTLATMKLGPTQVARTRQILAGTGVRVILHPNDSVRIEFPTGAEESA